MDLARAFMKSNFPVSFLFSRTIFRPADMDLAESTRYLGALILSADVLAANSDKQFEN
jgi:hypothetical protein